FLAYLLKVEKILFSSSFQYKKEDILNRENIIPCASSPFIDNEFKFASCSVVHDGWELYRLEKIKTIVDFKNKNNAKVNLHVCWYNTSGENCNLCEKCTRTYMSLIAMGEDPHEYGFNVNEKVFNHSKETFEEAILKKKKIGGWDIHKEILRAWNDNKSLFKQNEERWRNTPFEWILDVDFDELMENFDD
ncbi:MAG: hypothetical protein J6T31_00950, partial [Methanobrevibacter sp.]|nr:hypothetical protein [Methanobrevibacter sp.]